MATVLIRDASFSHLQDVLRYSPLRDAPGAEKTLFLSWQLSSHAWVGYLNNQICCAWGMIPPSLMSNQEAHLWLLATDRIEPHTFTFVRRSQIFVQEMLGKYPRLTGECQIDATQSIRWLKLLNAQFARPVFKRVPFQIVRKDDG